MKKTLGLFALIAIVMLTSCLKGDRVSTFNGMVGTFESVQITGTTPELMLRLDADGSLVKAPSVLPEYKSGDRAIVNFRIDYDNQSAEASKNYYFDVTNFVIEKIETPLSADADSGEMLPEHPILEVHTGYMIKTIGEPKRYLFTLSGYYNSANSATHKFQLYRKPFTPGVENDTLRYELRHDKMDDVENQLYKKLLYSFDCTYEMTSLSQAEKELVIELSFWDKQGVKQRKYLTYTYPKY